VTFAPYFWKEEPAPLVWGKDALEARIDAVKTRRTCLLVRKSRWGVPPPGFREDGGEWSFMKALPSTSRAPSMAGSVEGFGATSSMSFASRLAQPKQPRVELEPKLSMRELLEDNLVAPESCKRPVMSNVHGWMGRSSQSIDGVSLNQTRMHVGPVLYTISLHHSFVPSSPWNV